VSDTVTKASQKCTLVRMDECWLTRVGDVVPTATIDALR